MSQSEFVVFIGENCVVHALARISGNRTTEIVRVLSELGCSPRGATPVQITMALDRLGYRWSVRGTRQARGKTPREISNESWSGNWMIFTRDHVMPLVHGRVNNFNGCADEPVTFVMAVEPINIDPCRG